MPSGESGLFATDVLVDEVDGFLQALEARCGARKMMILALQPDQFHRFVGALQLRREK
jgi:hypothetical protein